MTGRRGIAVALCAAALCAIAALTGCSSSEAYTPQGKDPVITVPTIAEEGVLRVGVNAENAPLAGTSESSGRIVGLDVDIAAALADELGLKLEIVDVGTNAAGALEAGTIDVAMGIDATSADATLRLTDVYLPTATALFSSSSTTAPASGTTPTVAASLSSESAWAVTNVYGADALESLTNLTDVISALDGGTVDYAAADAINGTYAVRVAGSSAQIVALFEEPSGYVVGVLASNTTLAQAVSDALDTIVENGIVSVIESKWLGDPIDLSCYDVIEAPTPAEDADDTENASDEAENGDTTDDETTEGDEVDQTTTS